MKDNFSTQAIQYAKFRPTYPSMLYDWIKVNLKCKALAWDCATGNGQVATELAKFFDQVIATDISAKQLENAVKTNHLHYRIESAEETSFADHSVNLITVGQAIHWFKFDQFFAEVKRVLKPDGLFIAFGYELMKITPSIDIIINKFYSDIIGIYWDEERMHIEKQYETIPFPLNEIQVPPMEIVVTWEFPQLIGYLETWSAVQHYIKANGQNPLELVMADLMDAWGVKIAHSVHFPLIIKAGRHI
jgi:SAM-dependent methyltransferase